jgi:phosphoglycerate dehydrogenase-like enzyme
MNVVFPDHIELTPEAEQGLKALGVTLYDDTPAEAEIIARIADAEIITANYYDATPQVIDSAPKLKYIIVPAVGYEWVDHKYAAGKGIKVLNCPTHNSLAVAEHAIALMFALQRKLTWANQDLRSGAWGSKHFRGAELHGRQLGLIGYGRIGKQVKTMAEGLGMRVSHVNSSSSPQELDALLASSDITCLCLPLTGATHHLIDARRLSQIKPGAVLVNVGRGATIDQPALTQALKTGALAGAALDVFDGEPLTGKPSQAIIDLANLPNVVATPHIAYNTEETAARLGDELIKNLKSCLDGSPINVVN